MRCMPLPGLKCLISSLYVSRHKTKVKVVWQIAYSVQFALQGKVDPRFNFYTQLPCISVFALPLYLNPLFFLVITSALLRQSKRVRSRSKRRRKRVQLLAELSKMTNRSSIEQTLPNRLEQGQPEQAKKINELQIFNKKFALQAYSSYQCPPSLFSFS